MKRLCVRAARHRAPARPSVRLFLECLERRESPTDVLNMAARVAVAASVVAGSAGPVHAALPGLDAVLAREKPSDSLPIRASAPVTAKAPNDAPTTKQATSDAPLPVAAAQPATPLQGQQFFVTLGGSPLADPFVDPL